MATIQDETFDPVAEIHKVIMLLTDKDLCRNSAIREAVYSLGEIHDKIRERQRLVDLPKESNVEELEARFKTLTEEWYKLRKERWANVCASDVFQLLKHEPKYRVILNLLADGQISIGKCAEAIAETAAGCDPNLPEWRGYESEKSWKERAEELRQWKAEAGQVLDAVDLQGIGKLLNIGLGESISEKIASGIRELQRKLRRSSTGLKPEAIENRVRIIEEHLQKHDALSALSEGTKNVIRLCLRGESILGGETSIFDIYEQV